MNPDEPKAETKPSEPLPDALPPAKPAGKPETQPEAKATESKPAAPADDPKTGKPKPDPKALALTGGAKGTAPKPEAKAESHAAAPPTTVGNKLIFTLALIGILAGLVAAYVFGMERKSPPPEFKPVSNPYESAIYANGMIESDQPSGENINIFPEVSGPITRVLVKEGQAVKAGTLLFAIDDSVQRATTAQLKSQAEAALTLLNELQAEPRPETLAVATAQVTLAEASLKLARDQFDKDRAAYDLNPKSISQNALDMAADTVKQAEAALDVARRQYDLIKAGAWSYDIVNQEKQYEALKQACQAADALLQKYSVRAAVDGVVLAVNAAVGGYVSPQGDYDTYTELNDPVMILCGPQDFMQVRCYVDEILVSKLPTAWHMQAQMQIIGTELKVPLEFVRVQPYVSPKIELSNQKQEQVDLRVLPVIFRFEKRDVPVYPGQMVDVFIGQK
jgi:HlyD family secretion protein